jgi:hypothetical protein
MTEKTCTTAGYLVSRPSPSSHSDGVTKELLPVSGADALGGELGRAVAHRVPSSGDSGQRWKREDFQLFCFVSFHPRVWPADGKNGEILTACPDSVALAMM